MVSTDVYTLNQERQQLINTLWMCMVLSGADVSGYDGPEHWSRMRTVPQLCGEARGAVIELRRDYDE